MLNRVAFSENSQQAYYPMFPFIYLSQFLIIKPQTDKYFFGGKIFSCGSNEKLVK